MRSVLLSVLAVALAACSSSEQSKQTIVPETDTASALDDGQLASGVDPHSLEAYTAPCGEIGDPGYKACTAAAIENHLKVEEGIPTDAEFQAAMTESSSLKAYIAWDTAWRRQTKGGHSPGGNGSASLCKAMADVGLGCSYMDRANLVEYLLGQGTDLLPCKGGSNPYTVDRCDDPDHQGLENRGNFIGRAIQNTILEKSIRKNAHLFKNGDLSSSAARQWQA